MPAPGTPTTYWFMYRRKHFFFLILLCSIMCFHHFYANFSQNSFLIKGNIFVVSIIYEKPLYCDVIVLFV